MVEFLGVPLNVPSISITGMAILIVAGVVRSLIVGTLVPRSVLEDVRKDRDERIEDWQKQASIWRSAYEEQQRTIGDLRQQTDRLTELSRVSARVLDSLPVPAGESDDEAR